MNYRGFIPLLVVEMEADHCSAGLAVATQMQSV